MSKLPTKTLPKFLSVNEAATALGKSAKTLRRWEASQKLVPIRTPGGHRRYSRAQIVAFRSRGPTKKYELGITNYGKKAVTSPVFSSESAASAASRFSRVLSPTGHPVPSRVLHPTLRPLSQSEERKLGLSQSTLHEATAPAKPSVFSVPSVLSIPSQKYLLAGTLLLFALTSGVFALSRSNLIPYESLRSIPGFASLERSAKAGLASLERSAKAGLAQILPDRSEESAKSYQLKAKSSLQFPDQSRVLAAEVAAREFTFKVNVDSIFAEDLTVEGELTAPNILYDVVAGTGIAITAGQSPTISNTGVLSLGGKTGTVALEAGSGISIEGTKITSKITQVADTDTDDQTLAEVLAKGNTTGGTNIIFSTTDQARFRDADLRIFSSADGQLDIDSDNEIEITATTIDADAALDLDSTGAISLLTTQGAANAIELIASAGGIDISTGSGTSDIDILSGDDITLRAAGGSIDLSSSTVTLGGLAYTFPSGNQSSSYVLSTNGSGTLSWSSVSGVGGVDGSGLANYFPLWGDTDTLTNSVLYQSSGNIGLGTTAPGGLLEVEQTSLGGSFILGTSTGGLTLSGAGTAAFTLASGGAINLSGGTGFSTASGLAINSSGDVAIATNLLYADVSTGNLGIGTTSPGGFFSVGSTSQFRVNSTGNLTRVNDIAYSWPGAQGEADAVLVNDGAGGLSWTPSGGTGTVGFWSRSSGNVYPSTLTDNVGIGTSSPSGKFEVEQTSLGGSFILGTSTGGITLSGAGTAAFTLASGGAINLSGGTGFSTASGLSVNSSGDVAIATNTLFADVSTGNVGLGTTSPLQVLHVQGQCVTGDTLLRRRRRRKKKDGTEEDDGLPPDLSTKASASVEASGEGWEDVPIKDIKPGDEILTLDERTGKFVISKVRQLLHMGTKDIWQLTTATGKTIRTTANHPYLTLPPKVLESYLRSSGEGHLGPAAFTRFSSAQPLLDIHLLALAKDRHTHAVEPAVPDVLPFVTGGRWLKVRELAEGQMIATLGDNGEPAFERIIKIEKLAPQPVYDIEVEGTHNFVAGHYLDTTKNRALSPIEENFLREYLAFRRAPAEFPHQDKSNHHQRKSDLRYPDLVGKVNLRHHRYLSNSSLRENDTYNDTIEPKKLAVNTKGSLTKNIEANHPAERLTNQSDNTLSWEAEKEIFTINKVSRFKDLVKKFENGQIQYGGIVAHNTYISGNLGVGDSSPDAILDVEQTSLGSSFQLGTSTGGLTLSTAGTSNATIAAGGSVTLSGGSATHGSGLIVNTSGDVIAGNNTLVVDVSAGNVGIGTTGPGALFDIAGKLQVNSSGDIGIGISPATTDPIRILNTSQINLGVSDTANQIAFFKDATPTKAFTIGLSRGGVAGLNDDLLFGIYNGSSWSEAMRIQNSSGNVGIGTTTPGGLFEVEQTSLGGSFILGTSTGGITFSTAGTSGINVDTFGQLSLTTNQGAANALELISTAGGIDISTGSGSADIDILSGDAINLRAGTNGITLSAGTTTDQSGLSIDTSSNLTINAQGDLRLMEATTNGTNYTGFQAPSSLAADVLYTLPTADATAADYTLVSDAAGTLSWKEIAGIGGVGDITAVGSMISGAAFADSSATGDWLGLGAAAGRIEFDDQTPDEVNILSARVGIGDSTPDDLLDVEDASLGFNFLFGSSGITLSTSGTSGINVDTFGQLSLTSNQGAANALELVSTAGGIDISAGSGTADIDILSGDDITLRAAGGDITLSGNVTLNSLAYTFPSGAQASGFALTTNGSGTLSWSDIATGGNAGAWTLSGSDLYPDQTSYNVGIGTTSTAGKFDVKQTSLGGSFILGTSTGGLTLSTAGTSNATIAAGGSVTLSGGAPSHASGLLVNSSGDVVAGNNDLFVDVSAGKVGVGTAVPSNFQVAANNLVVGTGSGREGITIYGGATGIDSSSTLHFADGTTGDESYRGWVNYWHTNSSGSAYDQLEFGTAGAFRMAIASDGNVGIGDTSPDDKLDIEASTTGYNFLFGANGVTLSTASTSGINVDTFGQLSLTTNQGAANALELVSSAGGIDLSTGSATADIDVLAGASLNLRATESAADAITLFTLGAAGGIDLSTGGQLGQGGSIDILSGQAAAAAITIVAPQGGIDISTGSGTADIDILSGDDITLRAAGGDITLSSATVTLGGLAYTFPTGNQTDNYVLTTNGSGTLAWESLSGAGAVDGSGNANYLPLWADSNTLTDSVIAQSSGNIGIGTTSPGGLFEVEQTSLGGSFILGTSTGGVTLSTAGTAGINVDTYGQLSLTTNQGAANALELVSTAGGIDLSTGSGTRDINILGGASLNLRASESAADAITLFTLGAAGGIDISTGGQLGQGGSIDILSGQAAATAITIVAPQGGIDISTGSGTADIDILSGDDITLRAAGGDITLSGNVTLNSLAYTFPSGAQASGFALTTNGSGTLSWSDIATGGNAGAWTLSGSDLYPDQTTYNVGIGTTSTAGKLDVKQTSLGGSFILGTSTGGLTLSGAGTAAFTLASGGAINLSGGTGQSTASGLSVNSSGDVAIATNLLYADVSTGNVGIGDSTPSYHFDINQSLAGSELILNLQNNDNTNEASRSIFRLATGGSSAGDALINISAAGEQDWSFGVDNSDSNKFKISSSSVLGTEDRFTIQTDGNIGIGTTTPGGLFEVEQTSLGGSFILGTSTGGITLSTAGTSGINVDTFGQLSLTSNQGAANALELVSTTGGIDISTGSATGDIDILSGDAINLVTPASGGNITLSTGYNAGAGPDIVLQSGDIITLKSVNGDISLSAGSPIFGSGLTVASSGNIGIGTATPGALLDVYKTGVNDAIAQFGSATAGDSTSVKLRSGSGDLSLFVAGFSSAFMTGTTAGDVGLRFSSGDDFFIGQSASVPDISILDNGNIGITDATPDDKLDIEDASLGYNFLFGSGGVTLSTSGTSGINIDTFGQLSMTSNQGAANALELVSTAGGIDLSTGSGTGDIDILSGDAINLTTPASGGNITLSTGYNAGAGPDIALNSGDIITLKSVNGAINLSAGSPTSESGLTVATNGNTTVHRTLALGATEVATLVADTNLNGNARSLRFNLNTSNTSEGWQFYNANDSLGVMFIQESGSVVIGNSVTPGEELDVEGQIQFNLDGGQTDTTIGVCKDVADAAGVESNVEFRDCSSTPSDIAEFYEAEEELYPGEVVGFKNTQGRAVLSKTANPYQANILGVVSTNPVGQFGKPLGYDLIGQYTHSAAMALSGKVAALVSIQNGTIEAGDPLVASSVPGVAMKGTRIGKILGYALESFDGSIPVSTGTREQEAGRAASIMKFNNDPVDPTTPGVGKILVFVNPGFDDPTHLVELNDSGDTVISNSSGLDILTLSTDTTTLDTQIASFTGSASIANTLGLGVAAPATDSGRLIDTASGAYLSTGGAWTNASDVALKENFANIDSREILAKIKDLPLTTWNYRSESDDTLHLGPTAQDFFAAFGLGCPSLTANSSQLTASDDLPAEASAQAGCRSISTIDIAGVALAGIKALAEETEAINVRLDESDAQIQDLQDRVLSSSSEDPVLSDSLDQFDLALSQLGEILEPSEATESSKIASEDLINSLTQLPRSPKPGDSLVSLLANLTRRLFATESEVNDLRGKQAELETLIGKVPYLPEATGSARVQGLEDRLALLEDTLVAATGQPTASPSDLPAQAGEASNSAEASTSAQSPHLPQLTHLPQLPQFTSNDASASAQMTVSDDLVLDGNLSIDANLLVTGTTNVTALSTSDLTTIGTISIDPENSSINSLSEPLRIQSLALQPILFQGGRAALTEAGDFITEGTITASQVVAGEFSVITEGQTIGQAQIPAGATKVFIQSPAVSQSSKIFTQLTSLTTTPLVITEKQPGSGFEVQVPSPSPAPITFDYWIVQEE